MQALVKKSALSTWGKEEVVDLWREITLNVRLEKQDEIDETARQEVVLSAGVESQWDTLDTYIEQL